MIGRGWEFTFAAGAQLMRLLHCVEGKSSTILRGWCWEIYQTFKMQFRELICILKFAWFRSRGQTHLLQSSPPRPMPLARVWKQQKGPQATARVLFFRSCMRNHRVGGKRIDALLRPWVFLCRRRSLPADGSKAGGTGQQAKWTEIQKWKKGNRAGATSPTQTGFLPMFSL